MFVVPAVPDSIKTLVRTRQESKGLYNENVRNCGRVVGTLGNRAAVRSCHTSKRDGPGSPPSSGLVMTIKLGLERITSLLSCLADPHLRLPIIHVGGTNGKGSICAFLDHILRQAGYRVGRFTSPYLLQPLDSITLNGAEVDPAEFSRVKTRVEQISERERIDASGFEILTAVAFELFAYRSSSEPPLDLAIFEVGLGGTGDATNVCKTNNTLVSVVSAISLDHQAFLGNSIAEIARVKAGIAKRDVPMVLADQSFEDREGVVQNTFQLQAHTTGCDLFLADSFKPFPALDLVSGAQSNLRQIEIPKRPAKSFLYNPPQLPSWDWQANPAFIKLDSHPRPLGNFAYANIHTAVLVSSLLRSHPHPLSLLPSFRDRLTDSAICAGLASTKWRGRLEWASLPPLNSLGPSLTLLLDGAHNPAGAAGLSEVISYHAGPITLIFGLSSPRSPEEMIHSLLSQLHPSRHQPRLFATRFEPRTAESGMGWVQAIGPDTIVDNALGHSALHQVSKFEHLEEALTSARAKAREGELIVICGSLYLVADAIRLIDSYN
ncbi:hypothetical protein CROQUDRAFT_96426 [Cronartium quercuum f. sp. fusiforme G11]|uniref:Mur ligase C-terminal domain-containing protein n=1 Tax=Cronartium quercuum f. sp. fusiforme G11 TaxID=708437 RepID=A0A9P6NG02_9BASI|nr:hypothetical protein CROQUDRAFT_96426 [Cronartium quercuum f. sp. fusiforme G11]